MNRRPRIGKNALGWYLAIPTHHGTWEVIDNLPTHHAAHAILEHLHAHYPHLGGPA